MSHNTRTNSCNFHRVSHLIGWRVFLLEADTVTGTCLANTLPCPPAGLVGAKEVICDRRYVLWPSTSNRTDHLCQFVSISYFGGSGLKFRSLHLRSGLWCLILFVLSREIRGQHFDYSSIISCLVLSNSFVRHPAKDAVAWDIQWTVKTEILCEALEKGGVNLYIIHYFSHVWIPIHNIYI